MPSIYPEKNREYQRRYRLKHPERIAESQKRHRLKYPEKKTNNNLKRKYNITLEQYNKMFVEQEGRCAICKTHQLELKKTLSVDHNHETKQIRELLCRDCNCALGYIKENIEIVYNLIKYIQKHKNK
jgi:hypothetical protein